MPVRVVEIPKPKGGTRPLGLATVEERGVQTAMKLVRAPIFEADVHDCSDGYRPTRDAKQAAMASREALSHRAWGVVDLAGRSSVTRMPPGKQMRLITRRMADGRMRKLMKQTLQVGRWAKGPVVPTTMGGPQGAPSAPVDSPIDLPRREQLWHSRGYPAQLGATLPRDADEALLVCRTSARPALAAVEAMAKRRDRRRNRDKPREPRWTKGVDVLGWELVTRQRPTRGKHPSDLWPATSAQQQLRHKLHSLTTRRAPSRPQAFVAKVKPVMTGWVNSCRHTHASQAFRGLQRFVNLRGRRDWPQSSQGRGFGWKRDPTRTL